ncbi:hypothetical protein K402DRAFT_424990 [Aulographum hederae CBS 113979]|uniref:F-box domain-containing protein n=1 Tax=Aulographum hederae CBS 113979 TaxID=1176131 RepID=A0A6G1GLS6_9PEZI|nr:hypothetical protein K402DRAFT_424990 [Aulographum hederae CBS 113979]
MASSNPKLTLQIRTRTPPASPDPNDLTARISRLPNEIIEAILEHVENVGVLLDLAGNPLILECIIRSPTWRRRIKTRPFQWLEWDDDKLDDYDRYKRIWNEPPSCHTFNDNSQNLLYLLRKSPREICSYDILQCMRGAQTFFESYTDAPNLPQIKRLARQGYSDQLDHELWNYSNHEPEPRFYTHPDIGLNEGAMDGPRGTQAQELADMYHAHPTILKPWQDPWQVPRLCTTHIETRIRVRPSARGIKSYNLSILSFDRCLRFVVRVLVEKTTALEYMDMTNAGLGLWEDIKIVKDGMKYVYKPYDRQPEMEARQLRTLYTPWSEPQAEPPMVGEGGGSGSGFSFVKKLPVFMKQVFKDNVNHDIYDPREIEWLRSFLRLRALFETHFPKTFRKVELQERRHAKRLLRYVAWRYRLARSRTTWEKEKASGTASADGEVEEVGDCGVLAGMFDSL